MKRIFIFIVTLIVLLIFPNIGLANGFVPIETSLSRLEDDAMLLNDDQVESLRKKLDKISHETGVDVIIHTNYSLGNKTATEYADDYFDYNGFGLGKGYDGILFMLSMEERDWAISTHGFGIEVFTDKGQEYIMDKILDDLKDGNYYRAFDKFADFAEDFIIKAKEGKPYDVGNMPKAKITPAVVGASGLISLAGGAVVGKGRVASLAATHKTMSRRRNASAYQSGIANLISNDDRFVNKTLTRVPIPRETSSSRGSGGSSTHTSSSGRSHGGSSGKF